jgi:hypothetical protein
VSSDTPTPSPEKPLHVRVAEALGWLECPDEPGMWHPPGVRCDPDRLVGEDIYACDEHAEGADLLPEYDTDWSATGPLIERVGIDVGLDRPGLWTAAICQPDKDLMEAYGPSPLVAVCNLILALHAAGKLPEVSR